MFTAIYYHKKTFTAYAVMPGCYDLDTLKLEIELLENELDIEPIMEFEHRRLGEGDYWGHSVVKFWLHPSEVVGHHHIEELNAENKKHLKPQKPKLLAKSF